MTRDMRNSIVRDLIDLHNDYNDHWFLQVDLDASLQEQLPPVSAQELFNCRLLRKVPSDKRPTARMNTNNANNTVAMTSNLLLLLHSELVI